ncbi:MAG TPA: TonB-dependent receptor [Novosphingobium sp.]|nr:TonB-dependent receptor [Novosphingobium sp.]
MRKTFNRGAGRIAHGWAGAGLMAMAIAGLAPQAHAEAAAPSEAAGDIVVTARKSAEKLKDVPLAINAVSADDLLKRGSGDLQDVANYTPGLRFTDFLSKFNGNAVIRGLSQTNVQNAVGNTGVFIDGVYLQRGYMVDSQLGDLERIEVVKGPQSALYGQNTFAGAINYVLRQPTNELHVNGQASVGNGGYKDVRLGIGGPIIKDLLSARVYYANASFDGVWNNNYPGAGTTDMAHFGGYKRENFSASVKLTPAPGLTILGTYYKLTRQEKIRAFYTIDGNLKEDQLNCGKVGSNGSNTLYCGNLPSSPDGKRSGVNTGNYPSGLYAVPQPGMYGKTEMWHGALKYDFAPAWSFNYDFGDVKGIGIEESVFASNSAYLTSASYRVAGTTPSISMQREAGQLKYQSHDARFTFDNKGPFKADFGYFHSKASDNFLFGLKYGLQAGLPAVTSSNYDPLSSDGVTLFNNRQTMYWTDSGYARASYAMLDRRLTLAAEARYTHTTLRTVDYQSPALAPLRATYNNLTPRFSVEFKQSPDLMFYASAAKGVKAGGFNGYVTGSVQLLPSERSYGEEVNWTYEIGSKGGFFHNRLTYGLSLFYIDWQKRQISATPANYVVPTNSNSGGGAVPGIYVSGGAARSLGVELQAAYKVTPKLMVNGSFSWQDARVKNGATAPTTSAYCDNIACRADGNVAGNYLGNVPWLQGTIGADYRQPLGNGLTLFAGVDEVYRGKLYTDETNTASIAPYALTNGRLGIETDRWKAFVWGKNIFDHVYAESSFVVPSIYQYNVSLGDRRTFGATVSFTY